MKYIVLKAKQIKKSAIIKAEADVESIRLIGSAVKENPAYLDLQKIEASKKNVFSGFTAEVGAEASNLGDAIDAALALIPSDAPGRNRTSSNVRAS